MVLSFCQRVFYLNQSPISDKKALLFGSLPKKILRDSAESLEPPGAKISFLYFMPM